VFQSLTLGNLLHGFDRVCCAQTFPYMTMIVVKRHLVGVTFTQLTFSTDPWRNFFDAFSCMTVLIINSFFVIPMNDDHVVLFVSIGFCRCFVIC
jgi:hypothetical protein